MQEDIRDIKKKSIVSAASLFFQSGYASVLGLVANLALTILLSPAIFGIYITVLSMISFLNYFSDIGLAASLIQRKEITDEDVSTTFSVQQILILSLVTIGFLVTPIIMSFYNIPPEGKYLYWALLAAFFISSLKTIPSIFLERAIQFQKIVFVQVAESTVFYLLVVLLAFAGYGLFSFTIAVVARAITGLILIYTIAFWRPRVGISPKSLRSLLAFGIPFQASSFLALFKDDLIILYLGKALGFEAVGYIGWAKKWAEAPIRIIMDNVTKVLFPLIAKFQDDAMQLRKLIEKNFYYLTLLIAPSLVGIALIMELIVTTMPNYTKWVVALPLFYVFVASSFLVLFMAPFINIFNALGKVKLAFSFMSLWTILTWLLTPLFVANYNLLGFPLVHLLLSSTFILVIWQAKRIIEFDLLQSVYRPLIATAGMAIIVLALRLTLAPSAITIGVMVTAGAVSYVSILKFVFGIDPISELRTLLSRKNP
jgi:O-antigen/teichoic acid export membrane protein